MVINWDTIRAILLKLEADGRANPYLGLNQFDGVPAQEAGYHIRFMREIGLIEAVFQESSTTSDAEIFVAHAKCLTPEGHALLGKIRDPSTWHQIKSKVKEKGLDLSVDTIKLARLEQFPVPDHASKPAANTPNKQKHWVDTPLGRICIGVVVFILGTAALFGIVHWWNVLLGFFE